MLGYDESSGFAVSITKKPLRDQGFYGLLRGISAAKNNSIPGGASRGQRAAVGPFFCAW